MSSIKHIDYLNKSILYLDLEGSASAYETIDLGDKAKKLVKLSSRTDILVLYNLAGVELSKQVMQNIKRLMEHADLVSRRVIFGIDPRYNDLVRQVMAALNIADNTRYADNYTAALNLLTDDTQWHERRKTPGQRSPNNGSWEGQDRRLDPSKIDKLDL